MIAKSGQPSSKKAEVESNISCLLGVSRTLSCRVQYTAEQMLTHATINISGWTIMSVAWRVLGEVL